MIEQALEALRQEYARAGNRRLFERLKEQVLGESATPYADVAKEFGMKEGSIKTAVFRLRKRFAETLRAAIAHTVTTPEEIEEELNALIAAFRR